MNQAGESKSGQHSTVTGIPLDRAADTAVRVAERFGVPVIILAALLYLAREVAIGLHSTVIQPVVASHQKFIDVICEQAERQSDAMAEQASAFDDLARTHGEQVILLRRALPEASAPHREPAALQ